MAAIIDFLFNFRSDVSFSLLAMLSDPENMGSVVGDLLLSCAYDEIQDFACWQPPSCISDFQLHDPENMGIAAELLFSIILEAEIHLRGSFTPFS